jgi:hypothetical protein
MANFPSITRLNTKGHAAFLYNSSEVLYPVLAQYFEEGIEGDELCLFVTADEPDKARAKFKELGFDVHEPIESGQFRILDMNDTYLPGGHFDADRSVGNLEGFIKEAESLGHKGLRIAGEASWIYEHPEVAEDAHRYEARADELIEQNPTFIALCLYPVKDQFSKVMHDTSVTHPAFIHNGEPMMNLRKLLS